MYKCTCIYRYDIILHVHTCVYTHVHSYIIHIHVTHVGNDHSFPSVDREDDTHGLSLTPPTCSPYVQ